MPNMRGNWLSIVMYHFASLVVSNVLDVPVAISIDHPILAYILAKSRRKIGPGLHFTMWLFFARVASLERYGQSSARPFKLELHVVALSRIAACGARQP